MKTKYIFLYFFLGCAFLAVSFWVFLSKGKNAKALRTKYKLGGAMLTVWSMLTFAGCESIFPPTISCYDPVQMDAVYIQGYRYDQNFQYFNSGDSLLIDIYSASSDYYSYKVADFSKNVLQSGMLKKEVLKENGADVDKWLFIMDEFDYSGIGELSFYVEAKAEPSMTGIIWSSPIMINSEEE